MKSEEEIKEIVGKLKENNAGGSSDEQLVIDVLEWVLGDCEEFALCGYASDW